jgi:hypothetical protein
MSVKEARERFKSVVQKLRKAEHLSYEMLRHPDATPEHLQSAREIALSIDRTLTEMVTSLREVLPDRGGFLSTYEWNAPAYNRFYKPKEK